MWGLLIFTIIPLDVSLQPSSAGLQKIVKKCSGRNTTVNLQDPQQTHKRQGHFLWAPKGGSANWNRILDKSFVNYRAESSTQTTRHQLNDRSDFELHDKHWTTWKTLTYRTHSILRDCKLQDRIFELNYRTSIEWQVRFWSTWQTLNYSTNSNLQDTLKTERL